MTMKDFDEFVSDELDERFFWQVADVVQDNSDNRAAEWGDLDEAERAARYASAYAVEALRRYHEWVNRG